MAEREPAPLPRALRALVATGVSRRPAGERAAIALARRLLEPGRPYLTPDGFALAVDPGDPIMQTKMALGLFDPPVRAVIERYAAPGSVAIDAGAHIGFVSLLLARAVGPGGRVEAFEVDPRIVPRLREHVAANGFAGRIAVNEAAVWDEDGAELDLQLAEIPGLSYVDRGMWEPVGTARVRTVALDAHLRRAGIEAERLSLIKLDVEGAEPQAIEGMAETLAATPAPILLELQEWAMRADPGRREALLARLAALGYRPTTPALGSRGELELAPGAEPASGEDVLFLKG